MPPLLVHVLGTPARPGPPDTSNDPATVNGLAIVTIPDDEHGTPADTTFPALLNCAQSPVLKLPPPNQRFDPRSVHVLTDVQPYRLRPEGAPLLKKVAPTEQVAGNTVPVWNGLVDNADEKSMLLVCVRKSTSVCPHTGGPATNTSSHKQIDFLMKTNPLRSEP